MSDIIRLLPDPDWLIEVYIDGNLDVVEGFLTPAKLNELKAKYKYIDEEIINIKTKTNELLATEKKENTIKSRLPEYIYPIILENKIAGYYVKGIKDNNGIEYPKRVFDKKTNRWNLDEANKFVDILNYINKKY